MDYYVTDFKVSEANAVALEDSILKKGHPATAGSKMLENFVAPFDATVVDRLCNANIPIAGKTRMPEFGIGFAPRSLPLAHCCLCNDLFGQYRRQAAENNLAYIHPTYGTVSRYGLIPLASSMDQIGILCKNTAAGFSLLSVISGYDDKDGAMFPEKNYRYENSDKELTLCVPSAPLNRADERTRNSIRDFSQRFQIIDDTLNYFDVYKQTMTILSCAEISNNISRYDGVKFGYRSPDAVNLDKLYTRTRMEAFGLETKLAAIMGAVVLSSEQYVSYYEKAMKIRRLIKQSLCFDKYDLIVLPTAMGDDSYENLSLYALATLAGLPSVAFSYNGGGIQLIANVRNENALFTAWEVSQR